MAPGSGSLTGRHLAACCSELLDLACSAAFGWSAGASLHRMCLPCVSSAPDLLNNKWLTWLIVIKVNSAVRVAPGKPLPLALPVGSAIQWLEIFRGRFVVAFTAGALLLLDTQTRAASRLPWKRAGDERFCMEWPQVGCQAACCSKLPAFAC